MNVEARAVITGGGRIKFRDATGIVARADITGTLGNSYPRRNISVPIAMESGALVSVVGRIKFRSINQTQTGAFLRYNASPYKRVVYSGAASEEYTFLVPWQPNVFYVRSE